MAKYGSSSFAFFLADGYDLRASKLQGLSWKKEPIVEMTHGLGDAAEEPSPVGITKYALSQSGAFFTDAADGAHDLLAAGATAASRVVCFSVQGNAVGAPFVGCLGALTVAYEVIPQDGALTKANADYQITGHAYDGEIVQPWATKTADWNTKALGTVVDSGASSADGGFAFQQISAFTGFDGFVGKIRDSADDVTYADLATFANVTAGPAAEVVEVAGTVDRYLSFDGDVDGTGSITLLAGFARG
jgi:hypothetical protein